MSNYDVSVKPQIGPELEPGSGLTIIMRFIGVHILRLRVFPPNAARDPFLLPDVRKIRLNKAIKFPPLNSCGDPMARICASEFLKYVLIPENIKAETFDKIDSVWTEELAKGIEDQKLFGRVVIAKVEDRDVDYLQYIEIRRRAQLAFGVKPQIPASKESIKAMERVFLDDCGKCMVCLEDFEAAEGIKMPCLHIYHEDCIVWWLQCSRLCGCSVAACVRFVAMRCRWNHV